MVRCIDIFGKRRKTCFDDIFTDLHLIMCEVKELPETYQPLTTLAVCIFYSLCSMIWRTPRIFLWVPFVILPTLVGLTVSSKVQEENKWVTLFLCEGVGRMWDMAAGDKNCL